MSIGDIASDIEKLFEEHMADQPWEIKCADCGAELAYDAEVDREGYLRLKVDPCKCILPDEEE